MIGAGITTIGILLLVVGLVGAAIEVYLQLISAIIQQRLSAILDQLPTILQPEKGTPAEGSGPPFDSMYILKSLIETTVSTPLWLALTVIGVGLIYLGLFVAQRQRPKDQP